MYVSATQPKPTPKPSGGGPMGIDLSAITNIKLKKVGVPLEDRPKPPDSDKIYNEEGGVKSAFEKFKQKGTVYHYIMLKISHILFLVLLYVFALFNSL